MWCGADLLTLYLLVSVHGIDPILAGAVFLAGLVANAFADLGVGIWLARRPRDASVLAGGGLALAALAFPATVLAAPHGAGALLAATLAFRIAYAGCDVPHNALLARLGSDSGRAIHLARGRTLGTALASLIAAAVTSGTIAPLPSLWAIAAAAFAIGAVMVPLLAACPLPPHDVPGHPRASAWLPLPFLAASVIGIVALGALGKAVLHLPNGWAQAGGGGTILMLLIVGRTVSAMIPVRIANARRGLAILAAAFLATAIVAAGFAAGAPPVMLVLLGAVMGMTNLIGWALLPALARGPRGYGLYTMASKLALGAAGLALAGGLGRVPAFSPAGFVTFALGVAAACVAAALIARTRLTPAAHRVFSTR